MSPLLAMLLLALGAQTNAEAHYPGASAVFQCSFESSHEEEIYGWPPGWTRRHGPGFPRYVKARVDNHRPPPGGSSLRVELDGGAATAYGPDVPVNPDLRYVLEGYVETSGLRHDGAYLSLIFLDSKGAKLSSTSSEKISGTNDWQKLLVGPVSPPAGAVSMWVGLHVEPRDQIEDLRGTASFGALWLGQLPRIVLTAQSLPATPLVHEKAGGYAPEERHVARRSVADVAFYLFHRGQPIEIACVVSGFAAPAYEIRMQLLDFENHNLAEHRQGFDESKSVAKTLLQEPGKQAAGKNYIPVAEIVSKTQMPKTSAYARMVCRLPVDVAGFYRVRAIVVPVARSNQTSFCAADYAVAASPQADLSLAIIEPQTLPSDSEFGWSLDPVDPSVGLVPLGELLCQSGIRWVKFPFAIRESTVTPTDAGLKGKLENQAKKDEILFASPEKGISLGTPKDGLQAGPISKWSRTGSLESLIDFSDQLGIAGIQLAGVLQPPRVEADAGKNTYDLLAAEAFARDPKMWYPSIEPILARLGTEIRFWQLGDDRDPGWMGRRDLPELISHTKAELDRIGQDLAIGIAWNIFAPLPMVPPITKTNRSKDTAAPASPSTNTNRPATPWRFLSLPCDESISNAEIAKRLESTKSAGVARWMLLDIQPREGHSARERINQMVDRMLTTKMHGAEGIFVSDPLDPDRGLVDRDGSPTELFLPWRTTALLLGGATYVGDIDLPHGNQIHCFGKKAEYVGVLAGRKVGEETVYLGPELRTQDVWGNSRPCPPTVASEDGPAGLSPTPQSAVPLQQLPVFLVGLDGPITKWQLGVAFSPSRLPSIPGAMATVTLDLRNALPQSIAGRIGIHGPKNWHIEPRNAEFRLDPGAPWKQALEVALPNDVVGGRQTVRLDFELQAERLYRFTMYRPLEVTLGDVTFDGQAVVNSRGEIEVRQTLANQGKKPVGFRCDLVAPDRRRQSAEVLVQPSGKSEHLYCLPDGEQLLGKSIWLRAEEIDGPRVLNFRIEAPAAATPGTAPRTAPVESTKKLFQNLTWDGLQPVSVGRKSNLQLGFGTACKPRARSRPGASLVI